MQSPHTTGYARVKRRPIFAPEEYEYNPTPDVMGNVPKIRSDSLDDIYPTHEKRALEQAIHGQAQRIVSQPQLREQSDMQMIPQQPVYMGPQPQQVAYPVVYQNAPMQYPPVQQQYQATPVVSPAVIPHPQMTPDEIGAMSQRVRKSATHQFLLKAQTCVNCAYFMMYQCVEDGTSRSLCTFRGCSPWSKDFSCANCYCKEYVERGGEVKTTVVSGADMPKPRRKRRTKSETSSDKQPVHVMTAQMDEVDIIELGGDTLSNQRGDIDN